MQHVFKASTQLSNNKRSYFVLAISETISSVYILTVRVTPWTQDLGRTRVHKQPGTHTGQTVCPEEHQLLYNSCSHTRLFQENSSCYFPVTTAGHCSQVYSIRKGSISKSRIFFILYTHTNTAFFNSYSSSFDNLHRTAKVKFLMGPCPQSGVFLVTCYTTLLQCKLQEGRTEQQNKHVALSTNNLPSWTPQCLF